MISLRLGKVGLPRYRYKRHLDLPPGFRCIYVAYGGFNVHILLISHNRFCLTQNFMFICFHYNSLDVNVIARIEIFSNVVHWDTQEMHTIQIVNFLYVNLLTHLFLKLL